MPEWIQNGSIYYVQPSGPPMTQEERDAHLDKLLAELRAKLEAAKLKQKGITA